ncbi:peptidase inhibitor family I36 protein [Streptomyces sp. NPDC018057]|uniref:peptidase inhibitor family I36 protein n=1 Tax=unclassified Streptomyces TaxID=2593676 RepID=UPI0037B6FC74
MAKWMCRFALYVRFRESTDLKISKKSRAMAVSLAVASASAFGVTVAGTAPATAASGCNGICFYEGYGYSGQKSDQTKTLVNGSHQIKRFTNSHYQNGADINDSVTSIVNNTDKCLKLYYDFDFQHNVQGKDRDRGLVIGKYTSVVLDGHTDGRFNDRFSSVTVTGCGNLDKSGNWGYLDNPKQLDHWDLNRQEVVGDDLLKWNH